MKKLITYLIMVLSSKTFCQDTIFYDNDWKKTDSYRKSEYYSIITRDKLDTAKAKEISYFKSGQIRKEVFYLNYTMHYREGICKTWYKNGKLKEDANYKDNKLNGRLQTFWDNGQLKRDDTYELGKLKEGSLYNSDGSPTQYYDYEIMPQYPGGINELVRYISTNIKYPKKARRNGVSGKVVIKFIVDTDGSIQDVTVEKSVSEELDEEAIRLVKNMHKWQPGLVDGTLTKVYYFLPISFKLE